MIRPRKTKKNSEKISRGIELKLYDRCMGECCEDIGLPVSPVELKESYKAWVVQSYGRIKTSMSLNGKPDLIFQDIHLMYPMLKFLKVNKTHPESGKRRGSKVYHYTCIHFDKNKRKCGIYDIRPQMCRSYPDKKFCNNKKCRWKQKRLPTNNRLA